MTGIFVAQRRIDSGRRKRLLASSIAVAAITAGLCSAATAQTGGTPPAEAASASGLEEIVVTAQRREERLQDVPIAITAVTQETIQANRIVTVNDLGTLAPNFTVKSSAGGSQLPQFQVRGIFGSGVVPGSDKEVSIYLDGVYLSASRGALFDLPDIARIEVLRGPQGTLFGRNSTAGAISITTREPSGRFEVRQDLSFGNYNALRLRTTVDLPAWGPLSVYGSYVHDEKRGDIRNLGAGTVWDRTGPRTNVGRQVSPRYLGSRNNESFFGSVKFEPSDAFKTVYKFDHTSGDFTPEGVVSHGLNRDRATLGAAGALLGPVLDALATSQPGGLNVSLDDRRPKAVNNSFTVPGRQNATGHSLTSDLQLGDRISLKNIAAYRRSFVTSGSQLDGLGGTVFTQEALVPYATFAAFSSNPALATAPAATRAAAIGAIATAFAPFVGGRFEFFATNAQAFSRQWSDELQLNYRSDLLTLTAGGLYFHQKDRTGGVPGTTNTFSFAPFRADGRVPLGNEGTSYNKATSLAAFGQAEVHVTDQLDVVGGIRVTRDKKSGTFVSRGCFVPAGSTACLPSTAFVGTGDYSAGTYINQILNSFTYRKTKPTYLIGVNYKPSADILVYGKYSTGFVSGGAIGGVAFSPETVKSFEGGIKADLFGRRLRTNLALFHADYNNIQAAQSGSNVVLNGVTQSQLGTVIISNGGVKAYGFELETTLVPARGLQFTGALGYTHRSFSDVSPIILAQAALQAGDKFRSPFVPTWTGNVSGQYETRPLIGDSTLFVRVDGNYQGRSDAFSNRNRQNVIPIFAPITFIESYWVVNARVAVRRLPLGRVSGEVALWSRNLNNARAQSFPLSFGSFVTSSSFIPARTYGVDLSVKF